MVSRFLRILTLPHLSCNAFQSYKSLYTSKRFLVAEFETFKGTVKRYTDMYIYIGVEGLDKHMCKLRNLFKRNRAYRGIRF